MKPVVFHPEAIQELDDAVAYYAERSFKAASAFEAAIEIGVNSIAQNASRHAFFCGTSKRAFRLARFPYLIIYEELPGHVWVNAVAHERRHPDYWKNRKA
ncbi:type II toxin-antitoxin system RelE/ParE family toxin [Prosthecobacter sp.]|uniref:type II toxin-antitoxin system RelE/ParE family toxin n=1 Tax=Prosthecobacter sp. TaxID=1965333 RepID=UPI003784DEF8